MIQTILAPTDFSEGSRQALEYAVGLATQFGARLWVLHIGALVDDETPTHHSARRDIYHKAREQKQRIGRARMDELIADLQAAHPELPLDTLVRDGTPYEVICNTADELGADMIVMGTSGLTGLSHFLIGSTAERVVRGARVPVLTVRAKNDDA